MADRRTLVFILMLLGGIVTLIGGMITAIISLVLHNASSPGITQIIPIYNTFSFYTLLGMISGIMLMVGAIEVHHNRKKGAIKYWSTVGLAFAIISLFDGGGLVLGFVLAIIASLIGLSG
jgi:hypothetical protein